MALLSSLAAALSSKATVTAGAAVLMVGGGVAIAQSGSVGQDPPGHEVAIEAIAEGNGLEDPDAVCAEGSEWETAAFCRGPSHPPGLADDGENGEGDDVIDEVEVDEVIENQPEENGAEDGDDAQEFSEWVRSLPGEWGCIRGALVSRAAQAGPTTFTLDDAPIDGDDSIEEAAEAAGFDLENLPRCAEVAIARSNGDQPGPPEHAGRPDHAGPPANGDSENGGNGNGGNGVESQSEGRGNGGPPDHVTNRGNGNGPGNSGNARGNSGR